jgi:secreted PhoX family phosphatase
MASSASNVQLDLWATVPLDAEVTGIFVTPDSLFFNVQHPASDNAMIHRGTVGVVQNPDFTKVLPLPLGLEKETVMVAGGQYNVLLSEGINDMGSIYAADGTTLLKISNDPDFNGYVALDASDSEAHLFTNWEDRPGGMSIAHLKKDGNDRWNVVKSRMIDFSAVGGTWVNCFGTVTPWDTPISSEELYFDNTEDWYNPASGD